MKALNVIFILIGLILFSCGSDQDDCSLGSDEQPKGISFSFTFQTSVPLDSIKIKEHQSDTLILIPEAYRPEEKAFFLSDVFPDIDGSKYEICFPNNSCKTLILNYSKENFDDCSVHFDVNYNQKSICADCSSLNIYILPE